MKYKANRRSGVILISVIIFGAVFVMAIGALMSLFVVQLKTTEIRTASEQAFQMAESGINQFRWRLAHDEDNYTTIDQDVTDANGNVIGHVLVEITPPPIGSTIITIKSTAWSVDYPNVKRGIEARYGRPSYAQYAFLTNSNIWLGEDERVNGKLHSNGGIRIDGVVESQATTINETYICGPEHGCNNETKPGIWGTGDYPSLWDFPIADGVDFDVITIDLQAMKTAAQNGGFYLPKSTGYGYDIRFQNDGKFDVYRVTRLRSNVWGHDGTNWTVESNDIQTSVAIAEYQDVTIPANGVIFVEDQTWVSGQVNGRVTVAAAKLPEGSGTPYDIIINGNITYYPNRTSGSVLGLIAQQDILVPLYSANNLVVDAAMLAQNGHVFRYYYYPAYYPADTIKNSIQSYGTIITNTLWTWTWVNGSNQVTSGYRNTETIYDPALLYSPPPFFPTQDDYDFISWEELEPNEL